MGRRRPRDLEELHGEGRRRPPPRRGPPPGRRSRLELVLDRDGPTCVWCSRPFDRRTPPTTEHVLPKVKGGPSWLENEVAACRRCNGERGHASPVQWLDEVRQRGRAPREELIAASLVRLEDRIVASGGARRIRPALRAELRKLGRRPRV